MRVLFIPRNISLSVAWALALILTACGQHPTAPAPTASRVAPVDTCQPMPQCVNPELPPHP